MNTLVRAAVLLLMCAWVGADAAEPLGQQPAAAPPGAPRLIVRIDDIGFCHAANMAAKRVLEEGVATSVSVIVNTAWLEEAVELLRKHPEVSVGVHLTLNSEWKEYRWGPVLPYSEVPTLVDADGNFFPSQQAFFANKPKPAEVEKELRAQIQLALRKGLNVAYVDFHMGTAMATRELQEVVERLAKEFGLGISQYFGEAYSENVYSRPPAEKLAAAVAIMSELKDEKLYLYVAHPGVNTPEIAAMTDRNPGGVEPMAAHRQAEADVLCSASFRDALDHRGIVLTNYSELRRRGLEAMRRP
jgi:predicted glycoside hydrolase/deacetylase ChbG (UPF0249 family)